jgi:glycine cleavage system H protein
MNRLSHVVFRSQLLLRTRYDSWKSCATVHTSALRFGAFVVCLFFKCFLCLERKFTEKHEWIDGDTGTVGLSKHAQEMLGEIVYVQLPDVGKQFTQMGTFYVFIFNHHLLFAEEAAAVESVKAASDVYAPASGTVTEINETLSGQPNLINKSPHDAGLQLRMFISISVFSGWLFKMKLSNKAELTKLMDEQAYNKYVATLDDEAAN